MSLTVQQLAKMYRVPIIDLENDGDWLLLSAGTGLMLSLLDQVPRFGYALDVDVMPPDAWGRLGPWLSGAESAVGRICAAGWFSRPSSGQPLADALAHLARRPLAYFGACTEPERYSHCDLAHSLSDLLARLRSELGTARAPLGPLDLPASE